MAKDTDKPAKKGRPNGGLSESTVTIRLPADDRRAILAIADARKVTVSTLIRDAIRAMGKKKTSKNH